MARELIGGGELECFAVVSGTATVNTSSSKYDAAWSACAISTSEAGYIGRFRNADATPTAAAAGSVVYLHFYGASSGSYDIIFPGLSDINGRPIFRLAKVWPSPAILVQINNSTNATPSWVNVGTGTTIFSGYFDVKFDTDAATLTFYVNETLIDTVSIIAAFADVAYVDLHYAHWAAGTCISQVLVTEDINTLGARIKTIKPSAAGPVQQMTGAYGNLVKTAINDTTAVISDAAGQLALYEYGDVTVPEGMEIGGVWQWMRARHDGTSPNDLRAAMRVGSTDYFSGQLGVDVGFLPLLARWPVNPATSAAWMASALNGALLGMKSESV